MPLSETAKEFVRAHITSLIQLDAALLLKADAGGWWSAERLAAELKVSVDAARRALEELAAHNLLDVRIAAELTYRFAPWHASAAESMGEAASHPYEAREVVVRGGRSAAQRFADAFRVRKQDG
jgi:hypothetical protein